MFAKVSKISSEQSSLISGLSCFSLSRNSAKRWSGIISRLNSRARATDLSSLELHIITLFF